MLRQHGFWKRYRNSTLRLETKTTLRKNPRPDHTGNTAPCYEKHYLIDDSYPSDDPRNVVLEAHCTRYQNGQLGGSGLLDPKEIVIGDVIYGRLGANHPNCALCEGGDMIPSEERFYNARYAPATAPMPPWKRYLSKFKKMLNRLFDLLDQRAAIRKTMGLCNHEVSHAGIHRWE